MSEAPVSGDAVDGGAGQGPGGLDGSGDATDTASLTRNSLAMASGTIVSRVLGMVRVVLQASALGTVAMAANAWDTANTLPNIIHTLLAGGVLNAILVPQIAKAGRHADGGRDYVDRLLTLSLTALAGATVVFTLLAAPLVWIYGADLPGDARHLGTVFALICMPQVFFYGLYTLLGQVLNARNQFASFMWAPALANIVAIGGFGVFLATQQRVAPVEEWTPTMIWLVAGSATVGVAIQALVLIWPLYRKGFRYRPRWGFRGVGLRSASRVAIWTFGAVVVSQLAFVVASNVLNFAAARGGAGRAAYSTALLLFMLPHSLVTVSLITALFPRMSRAAVAGRIADVRADVRHGLRLTGVATVPITIAGIILARPMSTTIFSTLARLDRSSALAVGDVLIAMMTALIPFGLFFLVQRAYYAFEDARTPFWFQVVISGVATAGNVVVLLLVAPRWMAVGAGAALSLGNVIGSVASFVWLRRRLGGLPVYDVVRTYVRLTLASVVAAVVTLLIIFGLDHVLTGKLLAFVVLAVGGGAFLLVYVVVARRLRVGEIDEILAPLSRRLRGALGRS
ncbi:MAG TPA: murein biosynthesis integral membrane protein MurJ [Segeticoccus sp.]|jgi:putative peptidoglycan lipid II flippase|nr:murein biosynthesis integral membrane protein MurJ [Segeticoccus sp.]